MWRQSYKVANQARMEPCSSESLVAVRTQRRTTKLTNAAIERKTAEELHPRNCAQAVHWTTLEPDLIRFDDQPTCSHPPIYSYRLRFVKDVSNNGIPSCVLCPELCGKALGSPIGQVPSLFNPMLWPRAQNSCLGQRLECFLCRNNGCKRSV